MRMSTLFKIVLLIVFIPTIGKTLDITDNTMYLYKGGNQNQQAYVTCQSARNSINKTANKIINIAIDVFPDLLPSEYFLLYTSATGRCCNRQTGIDSIDNLTNADKWPVRRFVRAEIIRWLCTSPSLYPYIDPKGIDAIGLYIKGELDLSNLTVPFPVRFRESFFHDGIDICNTHVPTLVLSGSRAAHLYADGLQVDHAVFLDKFKAEGPVRISGAMIGSSLNCSNGVFSNPIGNALSLIGTVIEGDFICGGGKFINPNGDAIDMSRMKVNGSVFLDNGFKAEGMVCCIGAVIGGQFSCDGGTFTNPDSIALCIEGCEVKDIRLCEGFRADGEVTLSGSSIGGQVGCGRGLFTNPKGIALALDNCEVKGGVFLDNGFVAKGETRLVMANVSGGLRCCGSTFDNPDSIALNAEGMHASTVAFTDSLFGEGRLNFSEITVDGSFIWRKFSCPEKILLDLRCANINVFWDDTSAFPKMNQLYHAGLVYNQIDNDGPHDIKTRLKWLRLQPATKFSTQSYEQLAKVFESSGNIWGATKVRVAMKDDIVRFGKLSFWSRLWYWIWGFFAGYGYCWGLLFIPMFLLIILGKLLFGWDYHHHKMRQVQGLKSQNYPVFHSWVYSIDVFLPVIDLGQASFWQPHNKWVLLYYWLQILFGWVISTGLVIGISGLFH